MLLLGAWSGGMFHYKKGLAYKTSVDSAVLYQDAPANTLLNDVFCSESAVSSTTFPSFRTCIRTGQHLPWTSPSKWAPHIQRFQALLLSQRPTF